MGPGEMPPRLLRVLVDVTVRPLSNIFKTQWHLGKVLDDWKKANATAIFRKDEEEDPGNYSLLCLHSVTRKIMEPVLPEIPSRCMINKVMGSNQRVLDRHTVPGHPFLFRWLVVWIRGNQ